MELWSLMSVKGAPAFFWGALSCCRAIRSSDLTRGHSCRGQDSGPEEWLKFVRGWTRAEGLSRWGQGRRVDHESWALGYHGSPLGFPANSELPLGSSTGQAMLGPSSSTGAAYGCSPVCLGRSHTAIQLVVMLPDSPSAQMAPHPSISSSFQNYLSCYFPVGGCLVPSCPKQLCLLPFLTSLHLSLLNIVLGIYKFFVYCLFSQLELSSVSVESSF